MMTELLGKLLYMSFSTERITDWWAKYFWP